MRTIRSFAKYLVACGVAAAMLIGGTSANAAPSLTFAKIATVQGDAQYMYPGGNWMALKGGAELKSGAVIKTGAGACVYMSVNGKDSAVRVGESSVLALEKMQTVDVDSDTTLDVRAGSVAGSVKKLSKASHFDIRTPNGVAGIRGTSWVINVAVTAATGGQLQTFVVTVTCVDGQVVFAASIGGQAVTTVLNAAQSIVVGGNQTAPVVTQVSDQILATYGPMIDQIINIVVNPPLPPTTPTAPPTTPPTTAPILPTTSQTQP